VGAHLPYIDLEPTKSVTYGQCVARSAVTFPASERASLTLYYTCGDKDTHSHSHRYMVTVLKAAKPNATNECNNTCYIQHFEVSGGGACWGHIQTLEVIINDFIRDTDYSDKTILPSFVKNDHCSLSPSRNHEMPNVGWHSLKM